MAIGLLAILAILGILGYASYAMITVFLGLQKEVAAAILVASGTVISATVTVVAGRLIERRNIADRAQQEKRIPIYEEFVSGLFQMLGIGKPRKDRVEPAESDGARVFGDFTTKAIVWGSDSVLQAWTEVRDHFNSLNPTEERTPIENYNGLIKLEKLLLAMRKDLGLPVKKIQEGMLLGTIVDDLRAAAQNAHTAQQQKLAKESE
ncbi:hypothetical protein GCM10010174_56280 [Kutzneria viridogrisea]